MVDDKLFQLLLKVGRIDIKSLISDDSLLPLETFSIVRFQSIAIERRLEDASSRQHSRQESG
jgi:hypothetical protein